MRWVLGAAVALLLLLVLTLERAPVLSAPATSVAEVRGPAAPSLRPPASSLPVAPTTRPDSLAGTKPDGDWSLDRAGRLQPQRAVRLRFDYHLSRLGERSMLVLASGVREEAERELGHAAAVELMALWERYLILQQQPSSERLDPLQPQRARALLAEQQRLRRLHLGAAWAQAFYAEEEAALLAWLVAREQGQSIAQTESPRHPEAAEREAALQAEWADWERRLAQAGMELDRLRRAPELSAPQREQAAERLLETAFKPTERLRARALLGL